MNQYPWLPAWSLPISGETGDSSLPLARWTLLAGSVACAVLGPVVNPEFAPPWWMITVPAVVVAVLAFLTRRNGVVPWGVSWLTRQDGHVGLVETSKPNSHSASVIWLDPSALSVAQGLRTSAVLIAATGIIAASGRDPGFYGLPAEDIEDAEDLPNISEYVVAWDRAGAFWGPVPPEWREPVFRELGVEQEPERSAAITPLDLRITRQDLRSIAHAGVASAAMLETVFATHSPPDEADHALELGLTRCWPSRIDGLSTVELHELGKERVLAALRADLAVQVERDHGEPSLAEWSKRWTERLDALAVKENLAEVPAPEITGERPELSTVGRAALLVCASSTDGHVAPMRSDLAPLGVPAGPETEVLYTVPERWRVANALVTLLTVLVAISALTAVFGE
ncbi:hypothetical protein [Allokutzneria albata]|uniref:Uncharacterized protein n=1 Tax=Allokutzneria albata TaxID=211114 RepID=A0A1H0CZW5_ALLAB|nr:hypothetical protein [Allokutzneria albata]SDN63463.1 hypothetical protein SAMN04489726_7512 [Allokutzneria albata]